MSRGRSRARQLGYILPASSSCRAVWPRRDLSSRARLINRTMHPALQRRSESDSKNVQFGQGTIYTEWKFASSENAAPSAQYCSYDARQQNGTRIIYDIAKDGVI